MHRLRPKLSLLAVLVVVAAAGAAAVALASVTVYKNNFSSHGQLKQMKHSRGKHCKRSYLKGNKAMGIVVEKAPETCAQSPPVVGDRHRPDHTVQVKAKILKGTPKGIRKRAFVMAGVRVGSGDRYEFRVFPKTRDFELLRKPGSPAFPVDGHEHTINGVGKRNKLTLQAKGGHIKARVNGKTVASLDDPGSQDVKGTKIEVGAGNKAHSHKKTSASFDKLRVMVPNP
jgi:hypothetical protein